MAVFLPPPLAGDQRSSVVNESSSLLGGSPRRQCGRKGSPYHTGQLHPAVRVADLLQHINQMKTAEGYGFKQEYEVRASRASVSRRVGFWMDTSPVMWHGMGRTPVQEDAPDLELRFSGGEEVSGHPESLGAVSTWGVPAFWLVWIRFLVVAAQDLIR